MPGKFYSASVYYIGLISVQMGNRERSEKIRTYNYADNIITDHRTKEKFKNLRHVLAGGQEFDDVVQSLLNFNRFERLFELLDRF